MNILSIQSWVAYGHVGNAAAAFALQRLGAEVWTVNTVQFSNHTGYGAWTGQVFEGAAIASLIDGIAARGVLGSCDAVLSGYMGDAGIGVAIVDAAARVRRENSRALYCCDPVIGDEGRGVYVRPGIADFLRERAVPAADLLTPNQFELEHLTGRACSTLAEAKDAVRALRARMRAGPRAVLVTSLRTDDTPADALDLLVADEAGFARVRTPLLPIAVNGAGDTIAALFLFHLVQGGDAAAAAAAARAAESVHGLLRRTQAACSRELLTVAAQDEFVRPTARFEPVAC